MHSRQPREMGEMEVSVHLLTFSSSHSANARGSALADTFDEQRLAENVFCQ
jgi:hypothetical protein